jgi:hypothetical protein
MAVRMMLMLESPKDWSARRSGLIKTKGLSKIECCFAFGGIVIAEGGRHMFEWMIVNV